MTFQVGVQVEFDEERGRPYTIQAMSERFAVCTRPYKGRRHAGETFHSIIDSHTMTRGPDFWALGGYDYSTKEGCLKALADLESGECELSRRRSIPVRFTERSAISR
jgi:hypothetical protein